MKLVSILVRNGKKQGLFFIIVLLAFFSSANLTAQNVSFSNSTVEIVIKQNGNTVDTAPVKVNASVSNSNVNFILWFMGTKEDLNGAKSNDSFSKKSFLTSGREPNHLLLKTLLKKAINIKSC
jgi:hypothetical protein